MDESRVGKAGGARTKFELVFVLAMVENPNLVTLTWISMVDNPNLGTLT